MYRATVFIISKRKELAIKYKKLIEALNQDVSFSTSLSDAFAQIQKLEPELIIISDTIDEKLSDFCKQIRILTFNMRPTIVAVSKSSELEDKLETLEAGADDFLSEAMSTKEFQARIKAHLRRYVENSLNSATLFVQNNLVVKTLQKTLKKEFSALLIDVSGINFYKEIYGEIAYEKVLQTLGAIMTSTLASEDFAGHWSKKEFLIIAAPQKAERMASFLAFAFDNVKERFYSEFDYKNGFMMFSSSDKAENKIPLMKLSIGVLNLGQGFSSWKQAINLLYGLIKLCKDSKDSCYMIDRPKLYGTKGEAPLKNRVLILERDEALSYLLQTTCEMKGLEVSTKQDDKFLPNVVIIDYGEGEGIKICKKIKANSNNKVIFTSSEHKKKEILAAGADLYLPKPYDIRVITKWIAEFLK